MPRNDPPLTFPVRGVPGGYVDCWQRAELEDEAQLRTRAVAAERRLMDRINRIGERWRAEIARERQALAQ